MIVIKKMKNWYGIKELRNPKLIKKNTIIYAPNGVMKTSFAEGMKNLLNASKPCDVFNSLEAEFEIINNENVIDNNSESFQLDAIVFTRDEYKNIVFTNENIAKLLVSKNLKEKYSIEMQKVEEDIESIKKIISENIIQNSRYNKKKVEDLLEKNKYTTDLEAILNFLEKLSHEFINHDISKIKILEVFNDNTIDIFKDKMFSEKAMKYKVISNKTINEDIFKEGFDFDNLVSINKSLTSNNFFKAGHSLIIGDVNYTENSLIELIESQKKLIYGSDEAKNVFDEAKKILEKKGNKDLKDLIIENDWLLSSFSDYLDLKQKMINTKAKPLLETFANYKDKLLEAKKRIKKIFDEASLEKTKWKRIVNIYNQRFFGRNFELEIVDTKEVILDLKVPSIVTKLRGSSKELSPEIQMRFSSGEKKAMYILSLLFEIEIAKEKNKGFTLILDDIVESFDYKNKYATIEYLKNISTCEQIQLIILTHNFDFFRSCRLAIGKGLESKLLAYKKSGNVELVCAKSNEFLDFSFVNNWKTMENTNVIIALLPFIRNIYEIKEGSSSKKYKDMCDFLHFTYRTYDINLQKLDHIFKDMNVKLSNDYNSKTYFEILKIKASEIIESKPKEEKFMKKIVIGIFIRVAIDKILLEKYKKNFSEELKNEGSWTSNLYKMTEQYLSSEEIELYNSSVVIAPSFIHVNGFMYEPLIDIGFEKLTEVTNKILKYLNENEL